MDTKQDRDDILTLADLYILDYCRRNGYETFADTFARVANVDETRLHELHGSLMELVREATHKQHTFVGNVSTIPPTPNLQPSSDNKLSTSIVSMQLSPQSCSDDVVQASQKTMPVPRCDD